jgi:hypothetical protein
MKKFTLFAILIALFCWQNIFAQTLLSGYTKDNTIGNSKFGEVVTNIGDINNDGYDDFAVSTSEINSRRGRVYVYLGGTELPTTPDFIIDGEERRSYFGISVSAAGDFNNDGYDDFIVGSYGYSSNKGRAYIYLGSGSPDNVADVVIDGVSDSKKFGYTVSGIGDINKDGYSDVAVSEFVSDGNVYIYYGDEDPDNTSDLTIADVIPNQHSCAISTVGDFNDDGFDDFVLGISNTYSVEGKALIYYGGATPDVAVDFQITGESGQMLGSSVAGGDFNSDGIDDIVIGVPGYNSLKGAVYVLYGSNSPDAEKDIVLQGEASGYRFGLEVSIVGDINNDGIDDLLVGTYGGSSFAYLFYGSINPQTNHNIKIGNGEQSSKFGYSISTAGDVDNDGFDDFIMSEPEVGTDSRGKVFIYKGGAVPDNTEDATYVGEVTGNKFGTDVSVVGDINGDGNDDFIVSSWGSNLTPYVYVYLDSENPTEAVRLTDGEELNGFGKDISGVGDVNNDGYDDFIVGAKHAKGGAFNRSIGKAYLYLGGDDINNLTIVELEGEKDGDNFGCSVSGAGDVNNDGYDDFIVGAYGFDGRSTNSGKAYLYLGGGDVNNLNIVAFEGKDRYDNLGTSVSGAGDVNGDGYEDIIIGFKKGSNNNKGEAYVFYGGETVDAVPGITFSGTDSSYSMKVSSAGDVNGDGYDDVMIGVIGVDNSYKGRVYIYYGGETPDNTVDVTIEGVHDNGFTGYSQSALGDINGDGYDDIAVGTPNTPDTKGIVSIYYGAENMDAVADVEIVEEGNDLELGSSMEAGGDLNGDGFPDLLVGAPVFNCENGKVFLYGFKYKQNQTITFNKINLKAITEKTFTLDAVSSSGLPIEYTSSNTNVATISGNTVTIVGLGKTIITAKQIGNDSYNAAVEVSQELIIAKETQKINFTLSIDIEFGAESFDLEATSSSGLPITYTSSNTNVIAISGVRVTVVGAGETIITARQEGNDLYESSVAEQRVVVDKSDQTITFNELGGKTIGDEPFDLSATASSGLDILYRSSDEKVATISGNTVTIVGTGITTITASQAGDNNYNAAADIQQALTIFSTSSIKDAESAGIKLYPNPVSDIVNIESENYIDIIQILNVESRLLRTVEVKGFNKSIDISDLNRGVYFIKIKSKNNYYVIRVVKR